MNVTEYRCRPRVTMRGRIVLAGTATVAAVVIAMATSGVSVAGYLPGARGTARAGVAATPTSALAWPASGSAAVQLPGGVSMASSPGARPVPIASLAKVMTAYVVLRLNPLSAGADGFTLVFTAEDVAETQAEAARGESVVTVAAGERMTERQALQALLLPSANNVAGALARRVGTSTFVQAMNHAAARLGMASTAYTDPSGLDPSTVSTAMDQLRLAKAALALPVFAAIVGQSQAVEPVAGTVLNTDTLLGQDGFRGVKTGSDQAAGGCFIFAADATVGDVSSPIVGVVLGQRSGPLISAALTAARELVDSARRQL